MDLEHHAAAARHPAWTSSSRNYPVASDSTASAHNRVPASNGVLGKASSRYVTMKHSISRRTKSSRAKRSAAKMARAGITLDTNVARLRGTGQGQPSADDRDVATLSPPQFSAGTTSHAPDKHTSREGLLIHISPSDRVIPIGLEVQRSQADAHMRSATSPAYHTAGELQPTTPTILITPARENPEWNHDEAEYARTPTSIYSRPTTYMHTSEFENAPPVPSIPHNLSDQIAEQSSHYHSSQRQYTQAHNRDSSITAFEEDEESKQRTRKDSNATLFEEDNKTHPSSSKRHQRGAQDLTIETSLPTPRRSFGWWNYITTPFEHVKSPFFKSRSPTSTTEPTPPVPVLPSAAPLGERRLRSDSDAKISMESSGSECSSFTEFSPADTTYSTNRNSVSGRGTRQPSSGAINGPRAHQVTGAQIEINLNEVQVNGNHLRGQVAQGAQNNSERDGLRTSRNSLSSPGEREVPIMFDSDAESSAPSPQPFAQTPPPLHGPERRVNTHLPSLNQRVQPSAADHVSSPLSSEGAFSPGEVRVAAMAPIVMPRKVETAPVPVAKDTIYFAPPPRAPVPAHISSPSAYRSKNKVQGSIHHIIDINFSNTLHSQGSDRGRAVQRHSVDLFQYNEDHEKKKSKWSSCLGIRKNQHSHEKDGKKAKKRSRRRVCCICCVILIFLIILAVVVALAVTLSRKRSPPAQDSAPTNSNLTPVLWLNYTGFPGIPSGILSIAQPDVRFARSGCAAPSTLWSCAVPKEDQAALAPNNPDQPNFRFQILQNTSATIPSPSPPSIDEQKFLGNTTDQNTLPFEGEQTPFLISFLPTNPNPPKLRKREPATASSSTGFPDLIGLIPDPATNADGRAAPANLLPFPTAQPLRIYNRGSDTEHYGFYTYFDRTIFLVVSPPWRSSVMLTGYGKVPGLMKMLPVPAPDPAFELVFELLLLGPGSKRALPPKFVQICTRNRV